MNTKNSVSEVFKFGFFETFLRDIHWKDRWKPFQLDNCCLSYVSVELLKLQVDQNKMSNFARMWLFRNNRFKVWQFFVVAIIMGVGAFIFMLLSVWYKPKTIRKDYHELIDSNLTAVTASMGGQVGKVADSSSTPYGTVPRRQSRF